MLLSLDSGVSALEQYQQQLNVIANNIANVNTVGFKAADVSFADTLSETLGSNATGTQQVGTGVTINGITNDFSTPGSISSTGVQTDLAIQGNGFFVVKDPTSGQSFVTQDGATPPYWPRERQSLNSGAQTPSIKAAIDMRANA